MDKDAIFSVVLTVLLGGLLLFAGWKLIEFLLENLFAVSTFSACAAGALFWFGFRHVGTQKGERGEPTKRRRPS